MPYVYVTGRYDGLCFIVSHMYPGSDLGFSLASARCAEEAVGVVDWLVMRAPMHGGFNDWEEVFRALGRNTNGGQGKEKESLVGQAAAI